MNITRLASLIFGSWLVALGAAAQPIQQSGTITPGHLGAWTTNGVLQDAGAPNTPFANALGIVGQGLPFCIDDNLPSSPLGYHQMCWGANVNGEGLITYEAYGGAAQQSLYVNINGVNYPFGYPAVNGLPSVGSNVQLQQLPLPPAAVVYRSGFYAPGDGGAMIYTFSGTQCSVNAGSGDNGSQVAPATGTGCYIWDPPSGTVVPEVFGAKCDGTTNDTAPLQAGINAVQLLAGGQNILNLNAKTCLFTPPLTIAGPAPVVLRGQGSFSSYLKETAGQSANMLNIGYTAVAAAQTQGVRVEHIGFLGNSPTGGYAISSHHIANQHISDIYIGSTWGGIEDDLSNTSYYDDVWGYTVGSNSQGFLWWTDPTVTFAGRSSDQLFLRNIGINAGFYGNDGFVWEGQTHTLNAENIAFLQTNHGFWVNSAENTTQVWPAFGSIYDLQVEGARTAACEIDGGRYIYFTDSFCHSEYGETGPGGNQGENDSGALVIFPDYTASITSDLKFENMSIGISAQEAAYVQAQGVLFTNVVWRGASLKTPNALPSVFLSAAPGTGSADYGFVNNKFCGTFGDTVQNNYGIIRGVGVGSTRVVGSDFNYCQVGEIQDNSTDFNLVTSSSTDRNGYILPDSKGTFVSNQLPTIVSCGVGAAITGNSLDFFIDAGTGTFTTCTVQETSSNAGNNNGVGPLKTLFLQPDGNQGEYYLVGNPGSLLIFSLVSGGNMAGGGFAAHLNQAYMPY